MIIFSENILKILLGKRSILDSSTRDYTLLGSIFFAHFLINIGLVIGLLPVIGIPLPFISYDESSFLGFSVLVFLLLRFNGEKKLQ